MNIKDVNMCEIEEEEEQIKPEVNYLIILNEVT
jgi:hypothetical protein